MPKETVHWGKKYKILSYPETEQYGAFTVHHPYGDHPDFNEVALDVDGKWGWRTTRSLQIALETVRVDGGLGTETIFAFQGCLGVPATGEMDKDTIEGLQKALGVPKTGKLDSRTVSELQESLNDGVFMEKMARPITVSLARKPSLDVVWQRPDDMATPVGEDALGSVRISFQASRVDLESQMEIWDDPDSGGIYTDGLTRTQINAMIRTLKRARDAAFGADE